MKRIIFILGIVLSSIFALADEMPFYFFYFEPNGIPNPMSKKEAQKKLCQLVTKNCELSGDDKFTFTILPLYEKADLKSKETGYFVNVTLPKRNHYGALYESALASFVINRKGDRKDLTHYVSYSSDLVKKISGGLISQLAFDEGDQHKGFYAYVRADKAIPSTSLSWMKNRSNDGFEINENVAERWYGLANPDENGGVLWLRYKSDLRSPKFSKMEINKKLYPDFLDEVLKQFSASRPFAKGKGFQPCRLMGSDLTIMYPANGFITGFEKFNKTYKGKDLEERIKNSTSDCNSTDSKQSIYEVRIPLEKIYKNGFLVEGVGFWGIEWKEFVEFQEAYPAFGSFFPRKFIDQSELEGQ